MVKCNGSSNRTTYLDLTRNFLEEQCLETANWGNFFLSPHVKSLIFCIIKSFKSHHQYTFHFHYVILHIIINISFIFHIISQTRANFFSFHFLIILIKSSRPCSQYTCHSHPSYHLHYIIHFSYHFTNWGNFLYNFSSSLIIQFLYHSSYHHHIIIFRHFSCHKSFSFL